MYIRIGLMTLLFTTTTAIAVNDLSKYEHGVDPSLLYKSYLDIAVVKVVGLEGEGANFVRKMKIEKTLRGSVPSGAILVYDYSTIGVPIGLTNSKIGDRFLVFINHMTVIRAFEYSDELRDYLVKHMAQPARTGLFQGLASLLILSLPVLSMILRRRKPKIIPLIFLLQLGLYVFYESGIPGYVNIRVDLLLIYPAILWNLVILILFLQTVNRAAPKKC